MIAGRLRSNAQGTTLLEVMVAMFLLSLLIMALAAAQRTAMSVRESAVGRIPLALAAANLSTILRGQVRSGSMIFIPASGAPLSNTVSLASGVDATGGVIEGQTGEFIVIKAYDGKILFWRGATGTEWLAHINSPESANWKSLTPLDVEVAPNPANGFSRAGPNLISARFKLRYNPSRPLSWPVEDEYLWQSTFHIQAPLETP